MNDILIVQKSVYNRLLGYTTYEKRKTYCNYRTCIPTVQDIDSEEAASNCARKRREESSDVQYKMDTIPTISFLAICNSAHVDIPPTTRIPELSDHLN